MSTWIYVAIHIPFFLTAVLYTFTPPRLWHKEPIGRALVILIWTLTIMLSNSLIRRATDDSLLSDVLELIVFTGGFVAGWYLLITLLRSQHRGRKIRREQRACAPGETAAHNRRVGERRQGR